MGCEPSVAAGTRAHVLTQTVESGVLDASCFLTGQARRLGVTLGGKTKSDRGAFERPNPAEMERLDRESIEGAVSIKGKFGSEMK